MIELEGKFSSAKIFTNTVDNDSISQVITLLNQEFTKDCTIRMMPDIHAGAGCTIGTTMTIKDVVVPNLVGVDIGCGIEVAKIKEKSINLQKLDEVIQTHIPSGFSTRTSRHPLFCKCKLSELYCYKKINADKAALSCGTLGGGNHFIEAGKDEGGNIYLMVHSGSRHLGLEVATVYQNAAYSQLNAVDVSAIDELVAKLKTEGKQNEIQKKLEELKKASRTKVPKALAYVSGELFTQYLHDMRIVQIYAYFNRRAIMEEIIKAMGLHVIDGFTTVHNYIDTESMILRKGAVSAARGEKLIIPINMRDGSLICVGKGNPDWNYSAPHGAGRLMSRSAAKEAFSVAEFEEQMQGIYSTSVNRSTLDECPMAYKDMKDIVDNIHPTVNILNIVKPIYNFKAGKES